MKQIKLLVACAVFTMLLTSCNKDKDAYKSFVGTWGVEKIEYYNVDYAGNPIAASIEAYSYDPDDINNGIQLVFRNDKTGEMRDNDVDTIWNWNSETHSFDSTYIVNPDTTIVASFTYSYDSRESALYMNIKYTYPYPYTRIYMMKVYNLTSESFCYENEYNTDYVERAYLKRLSSTPSKAASPNKTVRPYKPGSLLGDR